MEKQNYFKQEISYIKDDKIKEDVNYLLAKLPDYFFEIPASTTLKYHPKFACSKSGLVKHTKVAVKIAECLLNNDSIGSKFSEREKDLSIMALILHDGLKCGELKSKYTLSNHPLLISEFIMKNKDFLKTSIDDLRIVCSLIESHMGQWNYDVYTKEEILPKPTSELARFVHMCDYLASRKFLDVTFDELNNIME